MSARLVEYRMGNESVIVEVDLPTAAGNNLIPAGGPGQKIAEAAESFDEALNSIQRVAQGVTQQVRQLGDPPDEVVVGFGIKLTGSTSVVLASGSAEANLEVTLTWKANQQDQVKPQ